MDCTYTQLVDVGYIKTVLGITDTPSDALIEMYIEVVSGYITDLVGSPIAKASVDLTFEGTCHDFLPLYLHNISFDNYGVDTWVKVNGSIVPETDMIFNNKTSSIKFCKCDCSCTCSCDCDVTEVRVNAGWDCLPACLKYTVAMMVQQLIADGASASSYNGGGDSSSEAGIKSQSTTTGERSCSISYYQKKESRWDYSGCGCSTSSLPDMAQDCLSRYIFCKMY